MWKDQRHPGILSLEQEKFLTIVTASIAKKIELTAETLRYSGSARVCVQGSSMLPSIRPGDEIELHSTSMEKIKTGDVVAYRRGERLFVHRVAGVDPLITRGDTLPQADAPVSESEFLGRVATVTRNGKRIELRHSLADRTAAALFRHSQPCAALFLKLASL